MRLLLTYPRQQSFGISIPGFELLNLLEARKSLLPLPGVHVPLPFSVEGGHPARELLSLQGFASRRQKSFPVGVSWVFGAYLFEDVDYRLPLSILIQPTRLGVQLL